jgi:RimJ/RimL family protein N-acetyltransferase
MPEPVLSIECAEPEGTVTRNVYPMVLTPKNLHTFWSKSRKFVTLFDSETRGDFHKFMEVFVKEGSDGIEARGLFWVVDDFVGVLYLTDIDVGTDARVHYVFFDGRHKGRLDLIRGMLAYVMTRYNFHRLTAEAPLFYKPSALIFAEQIGFIKEGRKRLARRFDNKWFDVNVYGLLQEEVAKWLPALTTTH